MCVKEWLFLAAPTADWEDWDFQGKYPILKWYSFRWLLFDLHVFYLDCESPLPFSNSWRMQKWSKHLPAQWSCGRLWFRSLTSNRPSNALSQLKGGSINIKIQHSSCSCNGTVWYPPIQNEFPKSQNCSASPSGSLHCCCGRSLWQ